MAKSFFVFELQLSAILKYAVKYSVADKNRNGLEVLVIVFDRFWVRVLWNWLVFLCCVLFFYQNQILIQKYQICFFEWEICILHEPASLSG